MSAAEPTFLTLAEVLYLHDQSLARFGGSAGIREPGWYGRGFHIAESQAFIDGNKRTAAASAIPFLWKNDVRFPKDDGSLYVAMIEIANKRLDKGGLAETLRRLARTTN